MRDAESDARWTPVARPSLSQHVKPRALSLTMRDGVLIAIDLYLPHKNASHAPAILRQTRYLRRLDPKIGGAAIVREMDLYARTRRVFLGAGYAWIDVDVRGTGASTGTWAYPWSADEVQDGAEIVDWIIAQPWSSGVVGSLGISYDGTCADMLATKKHPALRAIAPMFALYDVYTDAAFPGGIGLSWFTERWSAYNAALDRDAFAEAISIPLALIAMSGRVSPRSSGLEKFLGVVAGKGEIAGRRRVARLISRLVRGVSAAPHETAKTRKNKQIERQSNMNVHVVGKRVTCRDDAGAADAIPDGTIDTFSPHTYREDARASGTAIYSYSGWRDGAYPHAAIKRFLTTRTPGSRLTLGPWIHTGKLHVPAFDVARAAKFDHDAELLSFFEAKLRGREPRGENDPIHYFTMVEGRWKSAKEWPPPGTTTRAFHVSAHRSLALEAPRDPIAFEMTETGASGSGFRARWKCLLSLVPGDYPDRAERDAHLLHFNSRPLAEDTEVTGHPVATLFVSSKDTDAHVFVYVEDVAPDGRVAYVTEGQLRLLHRHVTDAPAYETPAPVHSFLEKDAAPLVPDEITEVVIDLLPISWLFRKGHHVRVVITGADKDHFDVMARRKLKIHADPDHPSRLDLPIAKR